MAKAQVKEIKYHEEMNPFGPNEWTCHIYTSDGKHYQGKGSTKEKAKENALEVLHAND